MTLRTDALLAALAACGLFLLTAAIPATAARTDAPTPDPPATEKAPADAPPDARPDAPTDQPPPAPPEPTLLHQGWEALRVANYPKAQDILQRAADESDDPDAKAEALYALAMLWQFRQPGGDVDRAAQLYRRVIDENPDAPAAPWAVLALARVADLPPYEKDRRVREARDLYQRLLDRWPDHPAADEAALRLAQTYLAADDDRDAEDHAVEILHRRLADRPHNFLAAAMHNRLAGIARKRGNYRLAIEHLVLADRAGIPGLGDRAGAYYRIAKLAEEKLKDYAMAAKWYARIVNEIHQDNKYYISKLAAERCRRLAQKEDTRNHGDAP